MQARPRKTRVPWVSFCLALGLSGGCASAGLARPETRTWFVYSEHASVAVFVARGEAPLRAPGLWLVDENGPAPRLTHTVLVTEGALGHDGLRACPCTAVGCLLEGGPVAWTRAIDAERLVPTGDPPCECYRTEPYCPESPTEPDPTEEGGDDFPARCSCGEASGGGSSWAAVALTGGRLYLRGTSHTDPECGGVNLYDAYGDATTLVEGFREPAHLELAGCQPDGFLDEGLGPAPEPGPCGRAPSEDEDADRSAWEEQQCDACQTATPETRVELLHRGAWMRVEDATDGVGGSVRWISTARLTPQACPSSADPCGDPAAFPALAGAEAFWVSSDGSSALAVSREGWSLLGPGGEARRVEVGIPPDKVLGVRFHGDPGRMADAMRRYDGGAAAPACEHDPACQALEQACEAAEEPEPGPEEPTAAESTEPPLAPEDQGFVDRRGGRDWGNRCALHLRAGRLAFAEAACLRGLAQAEAPGTRGAVLYNLGRLAEARGDATRARQRYLESLAVRPGNRTVQERLRALPAP